MKTSGPCRKKIVGSVVVGGHVGGGVRWPIFTWLDALALAPAAEMTGSLLSTMVYHKSDKYGRRELFYQLSGGLR